MPAVVYPSVTDSTPIPSTMDPSGHNLDVRHPDQSSSSHEYSSSSTSSSKHTSPTPSNRSDSNRDSPSLRGSKGKLFQCTGFGDCRMVFTRSEHLARHARKHTGEKPFQCVVEGCTRMFSRFDNMVQHTQTHTKGPRRESSAGIASKIAIEARRKSEAGLLTGSSGSARGGAKASKAKRASVSSASGSEAHAKKNRTQSMPMLKLSAAESQGRTFSSSTTPAPPSPTHDFSSNASSPETKRPKHAAKDSGKIRKKSQGSAAFAFGRKGSVGSASSSSSSAMSWYASKLHHQPSFEYSQSLYGHRTNLDTHLPLMDSPGYRRPRHPLSPERSSHSEDEEDSDCADSHYPRADNSHRRPWGGMADSMDCTLPPLRSENASHLGSTRLPSISQTGYRSQSIHYGYDRLLAEAPKTRRLSLADLDMPIQETKKAIHHSIDVHQAQFEGVDVSEDEIQALEAFGELWSQGRDIELAEPQTAIKNEVIEHEYQPYARQGKADGHDTHHGAML